MQDITTKPDIEFLIRTFYNNLLKIEDMRPPFEGLDFEAHIPAIVSFWAFVLLDEPGYKTNVFEKHLHLSIQTHQFDIWLQTFNSTVDTLFKGEKADLAKQRATVLSHTFKSKWEQLHP